MDFWSRLLSPLSSGSSRQDQAKDPAKRLHRFEKEYAGLLSIWRKSTNLSQDIDAAETVEIRLQELTNILSDESRRPLPHPCIQYASIKQIYVPIGKIATSSYNEWIIKEAVLFFATLIESEEEAFVENHTFSASLTNLLVRITGVNSARLGLDTESRVVELAFNITTKIRLDPEILPAWFKTQQDVNRPSDRAASVRDKFAGRTKRADFPLFYILMDYIHHEGKVGDFARTGLLYIIEAASSSESLEQWIVESDLSTLMATGLGALYSQLSRKLVIDHLPNNLPPILALSDYQHPTSNYEIVSSCSSEFQSHLETFLSHLLFWQDVLNHCKSVEVKSTLLEHFQVIFLQQLLYPSLLESSDIDGGSSVAVLTYLRRIIESLDHPDMINLILHYLLALPETVPSQGPPSGTAISAARQRKSMDLATMMAEKPDTTATPLLFNLVDLILACLRSRNQQTIYVTLQLVSAIVKRHHRYAVLTLLRTDMFPKNNINRTVGAHEQEIEYLMALAESVGGRDDFNETYESILKDTMARLSQHNHKLPTIPDSLPGAPKDVREHTLRHDDLLLNSILDLMENFFMNPVETNLSVTDTIVDMAICGYMSIEGWLARSPGSYVYVEDERQSKSDEKKETKSQQDGEGDEETQTETGADAETEIGDRSLADELGSQDDAYSVGGFSTFSDDTEADRLDSMEKCRRRPKWTQDSLPRILIVLKRLCDQVEAFKQTVPRFDELLQQRREAFQTADSILDNPPPPPVLRTPPPRPSSSLDEVIRSVSPSRPTGLEGFAQRLLSELGTPSRSVTPRGRKNSTRTSGASTPFNVIALSRSLSPSSAQSEAVVQPADFAAVDQSILARMVTLPGDHVKPIQLDLEGKPTPDVPESLFSGDELSSLDGYDSSADRSEVATEPTVVTETTDNAEPTSPTNENMVSVSHVITNVLIYQGFLLELASLMQVRAGLFNEVRFV
ncbi:retinoic acid induced 16-like protein domain-containing protein [Trichoderma breve]|uniref:Retinoic acid induced 16-like protein domain-containing protein n=1 Tax=Trichoderma breve TaxID=2034170 RepID=A0A9W9B5Z3_9HYPO|nr:retinoic acid induced 16-like protein domain-containing protein [Trichoderma breve]KAJ4856577.1 retinoic acid induced 16-like protein domain-containing protein [Trichoderma breve]